MKPTASDTPNVPPYRPTPSASISCTTGSNGMRCSTGGNSPAATRAASIGASLNLPLSAAPAPAAAPCSDSPAATAATGASSRAEPGSHRNAFKVLFAIATHRADAIPERQRPSTAASTAHVRPTALRIGSRARRARSAG